MSWLSTIRCSLAILTFFLAGSVGAATYCDPALEHGSQSPMAYRQRGDRCEGLYAQQVSALRLDIRSFVQSFAAFDPDKDAELTLAWKAPPGAVQDVRLRAFSLKPRQYFRMDTAVPAARSLYRWSSDVLAAVPLGRDDLGILAWLEMPGPEDKNREVYLPLRAGAQAAEPSQEGYDVTLVPAARLREVRVTLSRIDGRGKVLATLRRDEELGYGYYASERPTVFTTGRLETPGFYRLAVSATTTSGLPTSCEIDFYHSGE